MDLCILYVEFKLIGFLTSSGVNLQHNTELTFNYLVARNHLLVKPIKNSLQ
jgi:hypothetical protein